MKKTGILSVFLGALFALTSLGASADWGSKSLEKKLNLSAEQENLLDNFLDTLEDVMHDNRKQARSFAKEQRAQYQAQLAAPQFDVAAAKSLINQGISKRQELMQQSMDKVLQEYATFHNSLDDQQRAIIAKDGSRMIGNWTNGKGKKKHHKKGWFGMGDDDDDDDDD